MSRRCSACVNEARPGQRYCRSCHAQAQQRYRGHAGETRVADAWKVSQLKRWTKAAYKRAVVEGLADPLLREMRLAVLKVRRALRQTERIDATQSERRRERYALRRERELERLTWSRHDE